MKDISKNKSWFLQIQIGIKYNFENRHNLSFALRLPERCHISSISKYGVVWEERKGKHISEVILSYIND